MGEKLKQFIKQVSNSIFQQAATTSSHNVIVVTHGQETCSSFLEQINLPEILCNIAQLLAGYFPATCWKTCASLSCPMTCSNRAVFYSGKKTCASFRTRDAIAVA